MSIYWDNNEISEIYYGENISEVYFGSDLIWSACKYEPGQVIVNQASAGNYTWKCLSNGLFEIICVAGGGGGAHSNYYLANGSAGGGSGGGFSVQAKLTKGITYSLTVGKGGNSAAVVGGGAYGGAGGNSLFGTLIANGGSGGAAAFTGANHAGTGGSLATLSDSTNIIIKVIDWNLSGNTGTTDSNYATGGAAVYGNYGKGGNDQTTGNTGYVRVKFISKS